MNSDANRCVLKREKKLLAMKIFLPQEQTNVDFTSPNGKWLPNLIADRINIIYTDFAITSPLLVEINFNWSHWGGTYQLGHRG